MEDNNNNCGMNDGRGAGMTYVRGTLVPGKDTSSDGVGVILHERCVIRKSYIHNLLTYLV